MCQQSRATFCKQTSCACITYDINISKTYVEGSHGRELRLPYIVSSNRRPRSSKRHSPNSWHYACKLHCLMPSPATLHRCHVTSAHTYSVGTANIWKGFQRSTWLHLQIMLHSSSAWDATVTSSSEPAPLHGRCASSPDVMIDCCSSCDCLFTFSSWVSF